MASADSASSLSASELSQSNTPSLAPLQQLVGWRGNMLPHCCTFCCEGKGQLCGEWSTKQRLIFWGGIFCVLGWAVYTGRVGVGEERIRRRLCHRRGG